MQRRARQMRDRRLQGVEAIVERQQSMPSEGDNDGLFLDGQDRRFGLLRSRRQVGNGGPGLPFGDGFRVDAVALGQNSQALLTMVYRSTDRLCRCGAPMKNLSHSASFESLDKNAPLKSGTKHLGNSSSATGPLVLLILPLPLARDGFPSPFFHRPADFLAMYGLRVRAMALLASS